MFTGFVYMQWRIQRGAGRGKGHAPPPAGISYKLVNLSFIISGNIWQLHQYCDCENGLQMEHKSQEILHHLGTQKDAKLCLKCTKICLAAGLCLDQLGVL